MGIEGNRNSKGRISAFGDSDAAQVVPNENRAAKAKPVLGHILWCAWFSLLVASPYHVANGFDGPALSPAYAQVALGLLAGIALYLLLSRLGFSDIKRSFSGNFPFGLVIAFGCAATIAAIVPEWATLPWYRGDAYEIPVWSDIRLLWKPWQPWLLLAGSACCSAVACSSRFLQDGEGPPSATPGKAFGLLWPMASLIVGFSLRASWMVFYPWSKTHSNPLFLLPEHAASNGVVAALVFALAAATLALCQRLPWGIAAKKLLICGAVAGCAGGMLGYAALTRIFFVYWEGSEWLAFSQLVVLSMTVLLTGCRTLFSDRCRASRFGINPPKKSSSSPGDSSSGDLGVKRNLDRLSEFGLAPREREVALLTAAGLTSSQVAVRLDIKPSSVRSTLQRVYHKADVSGREELLALLAPTSAKASETNELVQESWWTLVALAGLLASPLIIATPHFAEPKMWGIGRDVLYGFASGLASASFIRLFAMKLHIVAKPNGQGILSGSSRHATLSPYARARILPLSSLLLLSGLALLLGLSQPPESFSASATRALPAFLFGVSWILCLGKMLCGVRRLAHENAAQSTTRMLGAAALVIMLGFFASLWSPAAQIVVTLASLAAGSAGFLLGSPRTAGTAQEDDTRFNAWETQNYASSMQTRSPELDWSALLLAAIAAAATGLLWEESWRSASGESLGIPSLIFAGSLVFMALWVAWRAHAILHGRSTRDGFHVLRCVEGENFSIAFYSCSLFFSGGCIAGEISVNRFYDTLYGNALFLSQWGGERAFVVSGTLLLGAFYGLAFASTLLLAKRLVGKMELEALDAKSLAANDRTRSYLLGRGLSETQTEVLLGIMQGESSSQIAHRLNYARGTVNSARDAGYKLLGVHSCSQLASLLSQHTGL